MMHARIDHQIEARAVAMRQRLDWLGREDFEPVCRDQIRCNPQRVVQVRLTAQRKYQPIRESQATTVVRVYPPQQIFIDNWVASPGLVRSDVPLFTCLKTCWARSATSSPITSKTFRSA
jgi:hypothetical protein